MRTVCCLLACAACAAAEPVVARWGNTIIVTAPADAAPPPGVAGQLLDVDFVDTPIADVADVLRRSTGLTVVVAPEVLAAAPTVTLRARNMALGNVLRWISTQGGMHTGWLHGAIWIADRELEGPSTTRLYDVSDLTLPIRDFPGPEIAMSAAGRGVDILAPVQEGQPAPSADEIADLIERTVTRK